MPSIIDFNSRTAWGSSTCQAIFSSSERSFNSRTAWGSSTQFYTVGKLDKKAFNSRTAWGSSTHGFIKFITLLIHSIPVLRGEVQQQSCFPRAYDSKSFNSRTAWGSSTYCGTEEYSWYCTFNSRTAWGSSTGIRTQHSFIICHSIPVLRGEVQRMSHQFYY